MMEEITIPKLTFMEDQKLTLVEELVIPKRIRIQCQDSSYFFDSKGVQMLDSSNILLELVESTTSLECDTTFMNCPKNQFTSRASCHRKLYSTINGKSYVAISSTVPISDSDFSTLHSLGIHGKTRRKDEKAKLFIKVYPQKPKHNIMISCGINGEKEYQLHQSSKPDEVTILHLEEDIGMEATNTLVDQLDKEIKNLQKEQKDVKTKQAGDRFRTQMDIWRLNQTRDEIGKIVTPIGEYSLTNTHMWIGIFILAAIVIIIVIIYKIKQWFTRRAQAAAMERSSNFRMSTIRRRRSRSNQN